MITKKNMKEQTAQTTDAATERPWNTLIGLSLGAIILYALVWTNTLQTAETITEFYAKNHAKAWTSAVVENFSHKQDTFISRKPKINDKYLLQDFQKGTNIYRYSLADADGRIFVSSNFDKIGGLEKRVSFNDRLKSGEIITTRSQVKAKQIDGFTMQSYAIPLRKNAIRQVIETIVPIMHNDKFVGSVYLHDDITNLIMWSKKQAKNLAVFLCAALTIVFLTIGWMIWTYSSSHIKQNKALNEARNDAEEAEKQALEMADKLQVMNNDISTLNTELSKNMKTLRNTQDEVIRKGKMAQLGQLTATVAHDIRNPLGSVRTSAFLLRRKYIEANPDMEKALVRIENGVGRCDKIITQLLEFSRSKNIQLKQANLDDWLVNLVHEQSEQMPREVSFECALGLDNKEYAFDADNLARAIINFLTNASEAMVGKENDKPNNPTLNPKITLSTALSHRGIEISVSDNGPGISEKNRKKILEPLFTTKGFGVGLGLPAVEKIFEQHGGGMEFESEEGKGAKFTGWIAINKPDIEDTDVQAA